MARVLIVDDELEYGDRIGQMLSAEGYEVRTAENSRSALELGRTFVPDILIADWMLRNSLNGLQVAQILGETIRHLSTILITGFPSPQLQAAATKSRVAAFLEKPFDPKELRDAVRRAADAGAASGTMQADPPTREPAPHAGRIGACSNCRLELPLLRATAGRAAEAWACAFCGNVYQAVFDESAPSGIRTHVRRVDR